MTKVSFIIPCRNKAKHVARCIQSVLDQTIDDFEFIISYQESEDDTYRVICDTVKGYNGTKAVRVLTCPDNDLHGMAGLNAHFNFIHKHVTGDLVISCSADDYNHPQRAEYTRQVYDRYNPSYIGTRVTYTGHGQNGESAFPDRCSRFIAPAECITHLIGSTASSAWATDLYEKYGPLPNIESQDMTLPIMALFERGLYYLDIPLHTYEWNPSADNTGVMGQQLAAQTDAERLQLNEKGAFHMVYNWIAVMRRLSQHGHDARMSGEAKRALEEQIMKSAAGWADARLAVTMNRIDPVGFRI